MCVCVCVQRMSQSGLLIALGAMVRAQVQNLRANSLNNTYITRLTQMLVSAYIMHTRFAMSVCRTRLYMCVHMRVGGMGKQKAFQELPNAKPN